MSPASELSVVVPVFNEADRIAWLVSRWLDALRLAQIDFSMHAYDDGSSDGTPAVLSEAARVEPRVIVHRHANRGHGPTLARAYAELAGSEWILQIDADDVIGPGLFERWWPGRANYDLMLASRRDPHRSGLRRGLTHLARATVRARFGAGVRDVNAPYRLMRGTAFRDVWEWLPPGTLVPNVLLSGVACRRGLRVREHPVAAAGRTRAEPLAAKMRWLGLGVRGGLQLLAPMPGKPRG
ncbi:MAG TPA: glycosyltransferase family 2 protein [Vicinamibacterales bacterium]|nr:glycosyltransferase family 2 protein [Vicinamibacterales bacterium]